MKNLTNSYSTIFSSNRCASLHSPIEICCTYSKPEIGSSTIITHPYQYALNARIRQLIDEFESLKDNWDEDDALAPHKNSIYQAKFLIDLFNNHGQQIYHAAPGPNGEIMLDVRNKNKNKSIEFVFYSNRAVYVSLSSKEKPKQGNFNDEELPELMNWLNCVENE